MKIIQNIYHNINKWLGFIISTVFWAAILNQFSAEKNIESFLGVLFFTYWAVGSGYVIGRRRIQKEIFAEGKAEDIINEYRNYNK